MKKPSKLKIYSSKRELKRSKEPHAKVFKRKSGQLEFVVQKHAARRLHYDFRLELDGVLKSWAVPKGPSLDPKDKRLAIMVEDHPYDYKSFEGVIPEGYGAGTVLVWDKGIYSIPGKERKEIEASMREGLKKGEIHFFLEGEKLRGQFALVRLQQKENEWLLIKVHDSFASKNDIRDKERSVLSERTLEEIGGPKTSGASLQKAPKKEKPHFLKPMLATLVDHPFDHDEWLFELKVDGFRALAELNGNQVNLYSRNKKSFNERFNLIASELSKLKLQAILDGEIAAVDQKGIPRFQMLQNQLGGSEKDIYYFIFDILYLKGKDLRGLPLVERKSILKATLKNSPYLLYLEHIDSQGKDFLKAAKEAGFEGIIGKKKQSTYRSGERTSTWVKIKASLRQEVVICGFTAPKKSRKNFGALIVGLYKKGKLCFVGHVGGGFTEKKLEEVRTLLQPDIQKQCPFEKIPPANTRATWVKPKHLCEVRFSEFTDEGIMRHPVFMGLREDKSPHEVVEEKAVETKKIIQTPENQDYPFLTHVEKLYWPKEKISKGAVLGYYAAIADILLPYLKDRPQSLKRFPNGIQGESFFQKNLVNAPDWVSTIPIEHSGKTVNYLLIQDKKSLLYAVNLGCIELHPWFSRYQALDHPDFLVFDLDPEAISFDYVVETALVLHEILDEIGVPNLCKTTGATGLHICVPLQASYTYEQAKQFSVIVANIVHGLIPDFTSIERSPKKRQKKVYIDCFQNNQAQTIVAPYSLRARPGAPVAAPLVWSEVKKGLDPMNINFFNILDRIKKKGDLFKAVLQEGFDMKSALKKIEKM
jgi:bifunctional non-homologous end joining protein LigD